MNDRFSDILGSTIAGVSVGAGCGALSVIMFEMLKINAGTGFANRVLKGSKLTVPMAAAIGGMIELQTAVQKDHPTR